MKKQADNIFTFGVGTFLILSANQNLDLPSLVMWGISILVVIAGLLSIFGFSGHGIFWNTALKNLDIYGPNGTKHDTALEIFDKSKAVVEPYNNPIMFFLSFAGSLTLMSGLLLQGWYVPLGFEIGGSAIGYGFIHYFQINKFMILGQITGSDEATE